MRDKFNLFFLFILLPLDFLMVVLGSLSAYYLRFSDFFIEYRPAIFSIDFKEYLYSTILISIFLIFTLAINGVYSFRRQSFYKLISEIFVSTSTTIFFFFLYLFFTKEVFISRFIILFAWFMVNIFLILGRVWISYLKKILYKKNIALKKIILIASGDFANKIEKYLLESKGDLGYKVVARISDFSNIKEDLINILENDSNIQEIWHCDPNTSREVNKLIVEISYTYHLVFRYSGGLFGGILSNIELTVFNGIPFIEVKKTSLEGWGRILKRFVDLLGSIIGIIIFSPIMIITAIAIKLDSAGPVFADIPKRSGQYGKTFRFLKFRSMYTGAHKEQSKLKSDREGLFKLENDPRITKVGHFIRKWSIDELPQFFNVLRGEMSLVGPRPHFPNEYEDRHKRVLIIKPGITGMGQISGRSDLSFDEEVQLDLYYIEHWSIWLDFWIILKTPIAILKNRKAS